MIQSEDNRTEVSVQRLYTVYVGNDGEFAAPIKVMAPNEHSARQRAMQYSQGNFTVTDVEDKLTPKSS